MRLPHRTSEPVFVPEQESRRHDQGRAQRRAHALHHIRVGRHPMLVFNSHSLTTPKLTSSLSSPPRLCPVAHSAPTVIFFFLRPVKWRDSVACGKRWCWRRYARRWQGIHAVIRRAASCPGMTCCVCALQVRADAGSTEAWTVSCARRRIAVALRSALRASWRMLRIHCGAHRRASGRRFLTGTHGQARARCWSSSTRLRSTPRSPKPPSRPGSSSQPPSPDSPKQVRKARAHMRTSERVCVRRNRRPAVRDCVLTDVLTVKGASTATTFLPTVAPCRSSLHLRVRGSSAAAAASSASAAAAASSNLFQDSQVTLADSTLPASRTGAGWRSYHVHGPYDGQGVVSVCHQQHVHASLPGDLTGAARPTSPSFCFLHLPVCLPTRIVKSVLSGTDPGQ